MRLVVTAPGDAAHADLPHPLMRGATAVVEVHVPVEALRQPSATATIVQEHVRWFDEDWPPASAPLTVAP